MGQDDGGLLENEWDGFSEVNIDAIIDYYDCVSEDAFEFAPKEFLLFSSHWSEAYLYLDMSKGDNPPVYNYKDGIVVLVCAYFSRGILVVGNDDKKIVKLKEHITNLLYV